MDSLMYGDQARHTRAGLQISPTAFHLYMENACVENKGWYYNMTDCQTFSDGILYRNGLMPGVKSYVQLARRLLKLCDDNRQTAYILKQLPDAVLGEDYSVNFLPPAMQFGADSRYSECVSYLQAFASDNVVVTVASISALLAAYIIVYRPLISRLDSEIKNVRALLLLFPDEVSRAVPAILSFSREMMKDTASITTLAAAVKK